MKMELRSRTAVAAGLALLVGTGAFGQVAANRPALIADLEITLARQAPDGTTLAKQTTIGRFLRDELGRTLLQQGITTSISDPVTSVSISLDTSRRKAAILRLPRLSGPAGTVARSQKGASAQVQRYLGMRDIDGFRCAGTETIQVIPVGSGLGNEKPLERVTEIWIASDISLPILVNVRDPISGTMTSRYINVRVGEAIDPAMFAIPEGYEVTERTVNLPTK